MTDQEIELDYAFLAQQALRGVIRDVLEITRDLGDVPGEHHFYIEFLTRGAGVKIADHLIEAYPERMTIVLQKKFEDLIVEDDHFEVTLHFKGIPDHLVIPYAAITAFVDPSVEFKLRFEPLPQETGQELTEGEPLAEAEPGIDKGETSNEGSHIETFNRDKALEKSRQKAKAQKTGSGEDDNDDEPPDGGADVVSLDAFRKK